MRLGSARVLKQIEVIPTGALGVDLALGVGGIPRGRVVEITEEGAEEHLNKLSQRYIEKDVYPPSMRFPGEVRALYKILPEKVTVWSPWGG